MTRRYHPFSTGTQHADWQCYNCDRCQLGLRPDDDISANTCDIEMAIFESMFEDGSVSADIAKRMGYLDNSPPKQQGFSYNWRCGDFMRRFLKDAPKEVNADQTFRSLARAMLKGNALARQQLADRLIELGHDELAARIRKQGKRRRVPVPTLF